jgi:hypothetical protein
VTGRHVPKDLIVGAVFADDQEQMLDQRGIADLGRDGDRSDRLAATAGGLDILRQIPVVVLEDLDRHRRQRQLVRQQDDTDSAVPDGCCSR